ncbi:hypothetical protein QFZ20_005167 [Flavobacterium sp. W4I14]|nr:hypothetical protein [Flavobacterium sp. W4I14]
MFHKLTRYYLFIISLLLLSCNRKIEQGFEKIPLGMNSTEALIRAIRPNKDYQFWVCIREGYLRNTEIITGKGDISYLMNNKFDDPKLGFIYKMWQGYFYIAYIENNHLKLAINKAQLINFIGKIDSIEEALLIADINNLSVDYERDIGSSYKKVKDGYEFYLVKFHKCTVRTEPFKVNIDTLGNYKARSLGFFYDIHDGICED